MGDRVCAVVQTAYGDPAVLALRTIELPDPGPFEVRIRHRAIGVNFHDIYVRTGLYRTLPVPGIPGIEAVGIVVAIGPGVSDWQVGQRAAYIDPEYGAYCEERNISASLILEPPTCLPDAVAATSLVRGMTAAMLLEHVYRVKTGDRCLVHAVGGSTGRLLASWARQAGAIVVGTAGRRAVPAETAALCDAVYSYLEEDWSERLLVEQGETFDYVCDSVGAPTFSTSLRAARRCGRVALFGQSGGNVDHVEIQQLAAKSLTVTRPVIFHYVADAERRRALMRSFAAIVEAGVSFPEPFCLPLADAALAHSLMEDRWPTAPVALLV